MSAKADRAADARDAAASRLTEHVSTPGAAVEVRCPCGGHARSTTFLDGVLWTCGACGGTCRVMADPGVLELKKALRRARKRRRTPE